MSSCYPFKGKKKKEKGEEDVVGVYKMRTDGNRISPSQRARGLERKFPKRLI